MAHFLETNVDLIEVDEPIDLMFDVTQYRAAKQVRNLGYYILLKNPNRATLEITKFIHVHLSQ